MKCGLSYYLDNPDCLILTSSYVPVSVSVPVLAVVERMLPVYVGRLVKETTSFRFLLLTVIDNVDWCLLLLLLLLVGYLDHLCLLYVHPKAVSSSLSPYPTLT
ncbi:unnamed protein product [Heterobilharzia americana]|nr:unnamed protein product [Heterobilharzia americana]